MMSWIKKPAAGQSKADENEELMELYAERLRAIKLKTLVAFSNPSRKAGLEREMMQLVKSYHRLKSMPSILVD
jgi:hypothetical protein